MTFNTLIAETEKFVKKELAGMDASHDYLHIERVRRNALNLATDDCDLLLVEVSALLHDIGDYKYTKE